ncbi:hypothetical protein [Chromobacterium sp.]|uniref:hypothetical protein n=1 Tax=Chromobacterium sp. TaxID=306190 RepID=UPI0035B4CCC0
MKNLFQLYGFEFVSAFSSKSVDTFTIKQGVFDNAYLVAKELNNDLDICVENLRKLGYATKCIQPKNSNEIHAELFNGFFKKDQSKHKSQFEYKRYVDKVLDAYPKRAGSYKYISAPYAVNGEQALYGSIIESVQQALNTQGPKLILIEAAAGFGKTSTAFEISQVLAARQDTPIVMLSELSRDRKAKIFRHVLLEEIDRSFPSLSSSLVEAEIKNGNIIVILDGFDELLRNKEEDVEFEKSEAMLETIAKLLENQAKVILTTRKTAILEGEEFHNWADRHENDFEIVRYSLLEPKINDWLPSPRIESLKEAGLNLSNINNPVLLSYLNYLTDESFKEDLADPNTIHDRYFVSMLEREQQRQKLHITIDEQSALFTRLADDMVSRNYTKDHRNEILQYFIKNEPHLLQSTRERYSAEERPDIEELATKLSNHAFLDRSSSDDRIGFINDFVMGSFVAKSIISHFDNEWAGDEIFIESAIEAYASKPRETKEALWEKLEWILGALSDNNRISFETKLLGKIGKNYSKTTINDKTFLEIDFTANNTISDTTICNCIFTNCAFDPSNIISCCFIDCTFYGCTARDQKNTLQTSSFINCIEEDSDTIKFLKENTRQSEVQPSQNSAHKYILEKFWPIGKESITFAHRPLALFYSKNDNTISPEAVSDAIEDLKKQSIIIPAKKKSWIGINTTKISEIAHILGRY